MPLPESHLDLLKPNDLARHLAVSRAWIYEAARTGRIPCVRIGGEDGPLRFVPEDIERWLDESRRKWIPGRLGRSISSRVTTEERTPPRGPPSRASNRQQSLL